MPRQSPVHYIAPSDISITPNANGSADDLAVYVARNARIKVFSAGIASLGMRDETYQEWSFSGRNRRLADSTKPYTIYARLRKVTDYDDAEKVAEAQADGYLLFTARKDRNAGIEGGDPDWYDKYNYVTGEGLTNIPGAVTDATYWYIRLGDVTLPENGLRTVNLDTGILGTDRYNMEWAQNPDGLPLRVELGCTIGDEDAGAAPYVNYGGTLVLTASLMEGWNEKTTERFDHWEITRVIGDGQPDGNWADRARLDAFRTAGTIEIRHPATLQDDDFCGAVAAIFTVTAFGRSDEPTPVPPEPDNSEASENPENSGGNSLIVPLASASITIYAETAETYGLVLSQNIVRHSHGQQGDTYIPEEGITLRVRATDQTGASHDLTYSQFAAAGLALEYAAAGSDAWTALPVGGTTTDIVAVNIPVSVFAELKESIDVRLVRLAGGDPSSAVEQAREHIAYTEDAQDTRDREWIFLRSATEITFGTEEHPEPADIGAGELNPSGEASGEETDKNQDGWVPNGWWDEEHGVDTEYYYEYASYRDYVPAGTDPVTGDPVAAHWGDFVKATVWHHYAGVTSEEEIVDIVHNETDSVFLSKVSEDTAAEQIGFLKGLWIKVKGLFGIDADGNAKVNGLEAAGDGEVKGSLTVGGIFTALLAKINSISSSNFSGHTYTGEGWAITNNYENGRSRLTVDELYVRARAIFEELVIKQKQVSGGDSLESCAASYISRVDYYDHIDEETKVPTGEPMGYTTKKVPWTLNGVVRFLTNALGLTQILTKEVRVRKPLTDDDIAKIKAVRCYFLASDGARKIENWWQVGDLAYCKTLDLDSAEQQQRDEYAPPSLRTKLGNITWWRRVYNVSRSAETLDDGKQYHYFDVLYDYRYESGATSNLVWCQAGSDIPAANDAVVQLGHIPPSSSSDTTATDRMNALSIEINGAGNEDAPCVKMLYGIYTYSLTKCWFGGRVDRMKLSPKTGYEFYGPSFKQVTMYDTYRVPTDKGLWNSIPQTRDDYTPHANVRKCYFYDRVSHNGSLWLCRVLEGQHWIVDHNTDTQHPYQITYNGVTYNEGDDINSVYDSLPVADQMKCIRVENYTSEEPGSNPGSTVWEKQVEKGDKGAPGNGIVRIDRKFAISASAEPEQGRDYPSDITSWSQTSPSVTDAKPYLWLKEYVIYTDTTLNATFYYYVGMKGDNGIDAKDMEFVYVRTTDNVRPTIVQESSGHTEDYKDDDYLPLAKVSSGRIKGNGGTEGDANDAVRCTDDPQGVDGTWKYEWEIKRTKGDADYGKREWNDYYPGTMTLHNNLAESALVIDLDNDNDQFGTDSTGKVLTQQARSTIVSMMYGTQEQAFASQPTYALRYDDGTSVPTEVAQAAVTQTTSGDNKKYTITVTIYATASDVTTMPFATHGGLYVDITGICAKGTKTIRFSLERIKGGAPGESPVIYQLNPTNKDFVFNRTASNALTPSSRSTVINALKTVGNETTDATSADNLTFSWGFDDSSTAQETGKALGSIISVTNTQASSHYQVWVLLSTGDRETLPIIKDGSNGEPGTSPYFADIDNEMDSVACDVNGKPVQVSSADQSVSAVLSLWHGSTEMAVATPAVTRNGTPVTLGTKTNGVTVSWNGTTKTLTVTYDGASGTQAVINGKDEYEITLTAADDDTITRSLTFTVNGVRPGANGEPAVLFQLKPDMTSIPFSRNADNTLTPPSRDVALTILKNIGGVVAEYNSAASAGVVVRYSTSAMPASSSGGSSWLSGDITVYNTDANLYIAMFNASGTLLDRETIPVIKDGSNGEPSDIYRTVQAYKQGTSTPALKPTATTIADDTTDVGNGWSLTVPEAATGVRGIDYSGVSAWLSNGKVTIPSPGNSNINYGIIRFKTTKANVNVQIKVTASSEENYDYGAIGLLDSTALSSATASSIKGDSGTLCSAKASGTDSATATISVATAGDHAVMIAYAKDGSQSSGNDNAVVEVLTMDDDKMLIYASTATFKNGTIIVPSGASSGWSDPVQWNGSNGSNGTDGSDGWSVTAVPSSVFIQQDYEDTSVFTPETVEFSVMKGSVPVAVNSIAAPSGKSLSDLSTEFNARRKGTTGDNAKKVEVLSPKVNTSTDKYYTTGSFSVNVNVTDPSTGQTVTLPVTVNCYAQLIGDIETKIKGDVETTVASKLGFKEEGSDVYSIEAAGTYIRSASEKTDKVSETVTNLSTANPDNLFGFTKGIIFNSNWPVIPYIQGYGFEVYKSYSSDGNSRRRGRVYNLGFAGEEGYYVLSCEMKVNAKYSNERFDVQLCDQAPSSVICGLDADKKYVPEVKSGSPVWTKVAAVFELTREKLGGSFDNLMTGLWNGFIDVESDTSSSTKVYVRKLQIERGTVPSVFGICKDDDEYAMQHDHEYVENTSGTIVKLSDTDKWDVSTIFTKLEGEKFNDAYDIYRSNAIPSSESNITKSYLHLDANTPYTTSFWAKANIYIWIAFYSNTYKTYPDNGTYMAGIAWTAAGDTRPGFASHSYKSTRENSLYWNIGNRYLHVRASSGTPSASSMTTSFNASTNYVGFAWSGGTTAPDFSAFQWVQLDNSSFPARDMADGTEIRSLLTRYNAPADDSGDASETYGALDYCQSERDTNSGETVIRLSTGWRKYYVHHYAENARSNASGVGIRLTTSTAAFVSVAAVKMEKGYITSTSRTEYDTVVRQTSRSIDMGVFIDSVKKAGIELTTNQDGDVVKGKVTAVADNFEIQNSLGDKTFEVDQDGNLVGHGNAEFKGILRARELFHRVCAITNMFGIPIQWADDKYYQYVGNSGNFVTGEIYDFTYLDSLDERTPAGIEWINDQGNNVFQLCTGLADIVYFASYFDNQTVNTDFLLPDPKYFEGKIVEVYSRNLHGAVNFNVGAVGSAQFIEYGYITANGEYKAAEYKTNAECTIGVPAKFLAVKGKVNAAVTYFWMVLEI